MKEVTSTRTMAQVIKVGMADLKVSLHPSVLVTLGLGSCVGVGLYEPYSRIIGMAHIMLPSSLQSTRKETWRSLPTRQLTCWFMKWSDLELTDPLSLRK